MDLREKTCHKCIHIRLCRFYNKLRKFGYLFDMNKFWLFGNICVEYKEA